MNVLEFESGLSSTFHLIAWSNNKKYACNVSDQNKKLTEIHLFIDGIVDGTLLFTTQEDDLRYTKVEASNLQSF